jgi:peptidoglycan/xylan/chitin deacetylase (PgdA/CDA1 family)
VSLCFDDGKPSQYQLALPALRRHGFRASFYLMTGRLEAASPRVRGDILARWRELVVDGHEIGNHTRTHPCSANFAWIQKPARGLEDLSIDDMRVEIDEAQRFLEQAFGIRPRTFAYPCGQTFVGRGLSQKSYVPLVASAFLVGRGFNAEGPALPLRCDLSCVPALSMDNKDAASLRMLVDAAMEGGHWLILVGHSIAERNGPYTTHIGALNELLTYLKETHVWVDTVERIGSHLAQYRGTPEHGDAQ